VSSGSPRRPRPPPRADRSRAANPPALSDRPIDLVDDLRVSQAQDPVAGAALGNPLIIPAAPARRALDNREKAGLTRRSTGRPGKSTSLHMAVHRELPTKAIPVLTAPSARNSAWPTKYSDRHDKR
jgi:hypothetical protein